MQLQAGNNEVRRYEAIESVIIATLLFRDC